MNENETFNIKEEENTLILHLINEGKNIQFTFKKLFNYLFDKINELNNMTKIKYNNQSFNFHPFF